MHDRASKYSDLGSCWSTNADDDQTMSHRNLTDRRSRVVVWLVLAVVGASVGVLIGAKSPRQGRYQTRFNAAEFHTVESAADRKLLESKPTLEWNVNGGQAAVRFFGLSETGPVSAKITWVDDCGALRNHVTLPTVDPLSEQVLNDVAKGCSPEVVRLRSEFLTVTTFAVDTVGERVLARSPSATFELSAERLNLPVGEWLATTVTSRDGTTFPADQSTIWISATKVVVPIRCNYLSSKGLVRQNGILGTSGETMTLAYCPPEGSASILSTLGLPLRFELVEQDTLQISGPKRVLTLTRVGDRPTPDELDPPATTEPATTPPETAPDEFETTLPNGVSDTVPNVPPSGVSVVTISGVTH